MHAGCGQVRGVIAERIVISAPLDPFLTLKALGGRLEEQS
jgi:hypothetical protein